MLASPLALAHPLRLLTPCAPHPPFLLTVELHESASHASCAQTGLDHLNPKLERVRWGEVEAEPVKVKAKERPALCDKEKKRPSPLAGPTL